MSGGRPKYDYQFIIDFFYAFHNGQFHPSLRLGQVFINKYGGREPFPELFYTRDVEKAKKLIWENFWDEK